MEMPVIHADGCMTNLGGATCNCGALAQRQADIEWLVGWMEKEKALRGKGILHFNGGSAYSLWREIVQELKDKLAELEEEK